MNTTWQLTGKGRGGTCEHDGCGRALVTHYEVTNTVTGVKCIVGRTHLKQVTGWSVTAAQAERMLAAAERDARRAVTWAAWSVANPEAAAIIDGDIADWDAGNERRRAANLQPMYGGVAREVKGWVGDGNEYAAHQVADYLERRALLRWQNLAY